jgi:hypothetical protein
MKLKVCLSTLSVSGFTDVDQTKCTNNGQHDQLAGHVIAEMTFGCHGVTLALLHPETDPGTGHRDVIVCYRYQQKCYIQFQTYAGQNIRFTLSGPMQFWPSGMMNLLQVCLALETHLEEQVGMIPALRHMVLDGVQSQITEPLS